MAEEALNIISTPKLGTVESAIVEQVALLTLDLYFVGELAGNDPLYHFHEPHSDVVSRRELFYACGYVWATSKTTTALSSFSRALQGLFNKGIVFGFALAWTHVEKTVDGDWQYDDFIGYAGPGRKRVNSSGYKDKAPVLSQVGLTELGWRLARHDNPEAGLCPMCKEIVAKRPGAARHIGLKA